MSAWILNTKKGEDTLFYAIRAIVVALENLV